MDDTDILQLPQNPDWTATLQVYYDLQQQLRGQSSDAGVWIARQTEIPGVAAEELSAIHGKLIAFGMLKFDVGGRDVGIQYQVTHQGRRVLSGEAETAEVAESA
jgi:hypothetical protein